MGSAQEVNVNRSIEHFDPRRRIGEKGAKGIHSRGKGIGFVTAENGSRSDDQRTERKVAIDRDGHVYRKSGVV
jgi:hypothetical protein